MIKIIKIGTRDIRECDNCGCLFSFDNEDILGGMGLKKYIKCPQCEYKIGIDEESKIKNAKIIDAALMPEEKILHDN